MSILKIVLLFFTESLSLVSLSASLNILNHSTLIELEVLTYSRVCPEAHIRTRARARTHTHTHIRTLSISLIDSLTPSLVRRGAEAAQRLSEEDMPWVEPCQLLLPPRNETKVKVSK